MNDFVMPIFISLERIVFFDEMKIVTRGTNVTVRLTAGLMRRYLTRPLYHTTPYQENMTFLSQILWRGREFRRAHKHLLRFWPPESGEWPSSYSLMRIPLRIWIHTSFQRWERTHRTALAIAHIWKIEPCFWTLDQTLFFQRTQNLSDSTIG